MLSKLHDYYFCFGLCHYAVSRSKKYNIDEKSKKKHLKKAIQLLKHAQTFWSIFPASKFKDPDRYFLALSYGFAGKPDSAVTLLQKIKPESELFKDIKINKPREHINRLIKIWNKK